MHERYPGYDVLSKRHTPSWNEPTRRVIDARLAMPREPRFFRPDEWQTLGAVCERIVPQPKHRAPVPLAAMVDEKMHEDRGDGYRDARLPKMQEAWRRGLGALDEDARARHGRRFHELSPAEQDALLTAMQKGELSGDAWGGMPCKTFFDERLVHDITGAYYAHPTSWNEIGFGGPASPRGYVRMSFDRRDPWEASEARPGREEAARRENRRVG
ncbi:MAG: gluconate 2-dehydrogenase subunit 3 family protein [Geminicoccaceae bacterium]